MDGGLLILLVLSDALKVLLRLSLGLAAWIPNTSGKSKYGFASLTFSTAAEITGLLPRGCDTDGTHEVGRPIGSHLLCTQPELYARSCTVHDTPPPRGGGFCLNTWVYRNLIREDAVLSTRVSICG
ncbi:uncharacterized protein EI90DRAFT_588813 [Cantharellus anzutake]|uniref:uncharacterized protein n=1 Tax=Cantharellus anzutake TaxID=1750568 RepID=UPI0019087AC8|nr:uncharacterized protein EI90DRAFT_588813 [Cantharellus anzutake]KAF8333636.1 hypothetical protein EI90DRAFT_588813 [Cantharellus anzutake]